MEEIPTKLNGARVVAVAILSSEHRPTAQTTHYLAGEILGPAERFAICAYPQQAGVYLFYCDRAWQVFADTWHASVAEAKAQAEFEYAGVSTGWKDAV
jgi:hypothetical protein